MLFRAFVLFGVLLIGRTSLYAQPPVFKQQFIQKYPNNFTLHTFIGTSTFNLRFQKEQQGYARSSVPDIIYSPNSRLITGMGLSYKNLRFLLSAKLPSSERRNGLFGETKYQNYNLNFYTPYFGGEAFSHRYSGLFLENPDIYDTSYVNGTSYPQRPDINCVSHGLNVYFVGNKDFSIRAAFIQAEKQSKSVASALVLISYQYININGDSSFVPRSVNSDFIGVEAFRNGMFNSYAIAPGFGFTLANENFFFTPMVLLGLGWQQQDYDILSARKKETVPFYKVYLKGSLGYNAESFYVSILYNRDESTIPLPGAFIKQSFSSYRLAFGWRL